jgi:hypothetical protein
MLYFQSQVDETAESIFCYRPLFFFFFFFSLARKVMAEASPTLGLIDKRVPLARYPSTHPPCYCGRQLWTLVCHHTYPQTFKGAPL